MGDPSSVDMDDRASVRPELGLAFFNEMGPINQGLVKSKMLFKEWSDSDGKISFPEPSPLSWATDGIFKKEKSQLENLWKMEHFKQLIRTNPTTDHAKLLHTLFCLEIFWEKMEDKPASFDCFMDMNPPYEEIMSICEQYKKQKKKRKAREKEQARI